MCPDNFMCSFEEYENSIVEHRIWVDSCQGGDPENEII